MLFFVCTPWQIFWDSLPDFNQSLQDFKDGTNYKEALQCLNEMVTDALSHGLDCLQYMASLQDPANLRFCAIPQVQLIT